MNLYLGVTDHSWYQFLRKQQPDEINFWQPGGRARFRVLEQGAPFLFKLKAPYHAIGGVGWFAFNSILPLSEAWRHFGVKNGVPSYSDLQRKITGYRNDQQPNPPIGCIILVDPVFFRDEDWIEVPPSFAKNIVQGKRYSTEERDGRRLWQQVQDRLEKYRWLERQVDPKSQLVAEPAAAYREVVSRVRMGQGTFRTMLTEVYQRRCTVTGEKTLPALEAAHIKPYAQSGPHRISNGLLLRSDLHNLFDAGYMTVTSDYQLEVSSRIREEFNNGKAYYALQGKQLILPEQLQDRPDHQYLTWHQEEVYRG